MDPGPGGQVTRYAHRVGLSEGQGALSPRVLFIARLGLGLAAAHEPEAALRLASPFRKFAERRPATGAKA